MQIKYYVLQSNESTNDTRNHYLVSQEKTEVAVGQQITHKSQLFQVQSLEIMDDHVQAVCLEILINNQ